MSVRAHASKCSSKSSASMAAVDARAKAEAARARFYSVFTQKEIEMRVKQAELKVEETHLEASVDALHQQCDAEAALAEANVSEDAASEMDEEHMSGSLSQTFHPCQRVPHFFSSSRILTWLTLVLDPTSHSLTKTMDGTIVSPSHSNASQSMNHHHALDLRVPHKKTKICLTSPDFWPDVSCSLEALQGLVKSQVTTGHGNPHLKTAFMVYT